MNKSVPPDVRELFEPLYITVFELALVVVRMVPSLSGSVKVRVAVGPLKITAPPPVVSAKVALPAPGSGRLNECPAESEEAINLAKSPEPLSM